jgi:dipeptidyl aminopeptidase/acylaminoacyl peptidase
VNTFMLGQPGAQDSSAAYVTTVRFGPGLSIDAVDLVRLDTATGATDPVVGPGHVRRWWLDAKGRPALALAVDGGRDILYRYDMKADTWRELRSRVHTAYADDGVALSPAVHAEGDANRVVVSGHRKGTRNFMPLGFAPDGTLYVISHQNRDTDALFVYDPVADKLADKPVVDLESYDFSGALVANAARLLGIRYVADEENTAWFDPAMKAAQQTVDKLLPGRVNLLSVGVRSETPYVLVESWSDRQPHDYLMLDRKTGKLTVIGRSRPAIAANQMGRQALVQVKARDGQMIPTWVTMPPGAPDKHLPMVVLVHGGPQLRGHAWEWNAESQFLASRGYVVLAPEFRGSTGYGAAHFRAGWKQWGLAMQDDVADATRWAIGEGIADPKRICIAGGGYGGYATLMGLVRDPDLYRCGIDWAGVTDIDLLFKGHYTAESDMPGEWRQSGLPAMVGDPALDAAQFAAASPLKQAARITHPLLLAYGEDDRRVPLYHGRLFHDAVRKTNQNVEWVGYKKEGYDGGLAYGKDDRPEWLFERPNGDHAVPAEGSITNIDDEINWVVYEKEGRGWGMVKTRVDFWSRVEKFLQRQIGGGAMRMP